MDGVDWLQVGTLVAVTISAMGNVAALWWTWQERRGR